MRKSCSIETLWIPSSILRIVCYFIKICEYKRKPRRRNMCDKISSLLLCVVTCINQVKNEQNKRIKFYFLVEEPRQFTRYSLY